MHSRRVVVRMESLWCVEGLRYVKCRELCESGELVLVVES